MVKWRADFLLLFEENRTGKKREFLELLKKRWGDKIRITKTKMSHDVEIGMKMECYTEPAFMPFYLHAGPFPVERTSKLYSNSGLTFYTDLMSDSHASEQELFYEIFLTACKVLKPVFGSVQSTEWGTERESTRPCTDQAEYYQNPYLFCVEPPLSDYHFSDDSYIKAFYDFLRGDELTTKLAEVENVMSRSELVEIIRQHVEKVIESDDGGIGVLKGTGVQACYPRYFIRQELRRRGVQLKDGLSEQYAKEFGIK